MLFQLLMKSCSTDWLLRLIGQEVRALRGSRPPAKIKCTTNTRYRFCVKVWNSSAVKRHGFKLGFSAENIFQTISKYKQKMCLLVDAKRITAEIPVLPIMPPHHEIQGLLQWKGSCMVRKVLYNYPMLIIIQLCFSSNSV